MDKAFGGLRARLSSAAASAAGTMRNLRAGTARAAEPGNPATEASGPPAIFARARPKRVHIIEKYRYRQQISLNPSLESCDEPTGRIDAVVPYDGDRFFTQDAIKDVTSRLGESDDSVESTHALIGHLVLTNVQDAVRTNGLPLVPLHGAIPLHVAVQSPELRHRDDLSSDAHESWLRIDYVPPSADEYPYPAMVRATLDDPEDLRESPSSLRERADAISAQIVRQAAFSAELRLTMRVRLLWPKRAPQPPTAKIKRVSLSWPTVTSLSPSSLRFSLGGIARDLQYRPESSELEWLGVPIDREVEQQPSAGPDAAEPTQPEPEDGPEDGTASGAEGEDDGDQPSTSGGSSRAARVPGGWHDADNDDHDEAEQRDNDVWRMNSADMGLAIRQPGELLSEIELNGEVEIEVEDALLSGMDARLFDATGRRHRKGILALRTNLTVRFTLVLEDMFDGRLVSATHTLHFDEVIPDDRRVEDIMAVLRDRGFDATKLPMDHDDDAPRWLVEARRKEGPNEIVLWLDVQGRRYTTRRRAETPGWHRYTTDLDSGELRVVVWGSVPRRSSELTTEINELRESLTVRFRHVEAQR